MLHACEAQLLDPIVQRMDIRLVNFDQNVVILAICAAERLWLARVPSIALLLVAFVSRHQLQEGHVLNNDLSCHVA